MCNQANYIVIKLLTFVMFIKIFNCKVCQWFSNKTDSYDIIRNIVECGVTYPITTNYSID